MPALFIAFVAPFLAQQAPIPTLKVDVDLALINVTITDPEGRYVVGLEKKTTAVTRLAIFETL